MNRIIRSGRGIYNNPGKQIISCTSPWLPSSPNSGSGPVVQRAWARVVPTLYASLNVRCCCCCRHDAASSTRRRKRTQLHLRDARTNDGGHRGRQLPGVWDARRRHVRHQARHHPTYSRCRTNGHHRRRATGIDWLYLIIPAWLTRVLRELHA